MDIQGFKKCHTHLVCIDSDGTAMDVMSVKHYKCFAPCFINEWGLANHSAEVLEAWVDINLYNVTRGKNRFLGLLEILEKFNGRLLNVEGLAQFKQWTITTKELSDRCLKQQSEESDNIIFKKALKWSWDTNILIANLTYNDIKPFSGTLEFLKLAKGRVDIAIVSSANYNSISEEWKHYDILKYADVVATQESGTKKQCILQLLEKGYKKENVIKLGDAITDKDAALANGINFYPILPSKEQQSWEQFKNKYFDLFLLGQFGEYQQQLIEEFYNNFNK